MLENWKYSAVVRDVDGNILEISQVTTTDKVKVLFKESYRILRSIFNTENTQDIHYHSITFYRYDTPFLEMSVGFFAISWHRVGGENYKSHGWIKDNLYKIKV